MLQGKAIAEAIRIKLQSSDTFAFTETLAGVFGPFVSDLDDEQLKSFEGDAVPEAVRQLGSSWLEKIPQAKVKTKSRLALEMLVCNLSILLIKTN